MSFWFYRKDKNGKRYVYSVTIPLELIILIFGLLVGILTPRYLMDSNQFGRDSLMLVLFGFLLFFVSKLSLFLKGIWNSWGSKMMNKPFKLLYHSGYTFMFIGILGTSPFLIKG